MPTITGTIPDANAIGKIKSPVNQSIPARINEHEYITPRAWKTYEKILFRVAFVFFIAISIPNNAEWYRQVFTTDWTNAHYRDLYDVARFSSGVNWFGNTIFGNPLLGYANWIITLLVSIAVGLIWTFIARARKKERAAYNTAYYWLRAIVRYRAAIGIIGFGFTKLLPVQMPYPSLGILNTSFGDLTAQKVFWLSVGIVPWYQVFTGVVEVLAGGLLLFRKTTTLGAILLFGALGDIVYVNFAYDGGVHVYSSYFVLLAAFLLVHDVPKICNLLVRERYTIPFKYYPPLGKGLKWLRIGLKTATVLVFLVWLFYLQLINFWYDPYKQPSVAGVKQLRGNYAVTEFRINGTEIPYSPLDTVRWQEATFENWSTFTFRVNKPTPLDLSNGGGDPQRDINRTFELTGVAGGLRAFHYQADEVNRTLYLEDKFKAVPDRRNRAAGAGGDSSAHASAAVQKNIASLSKKENSKYGPDWISKEALANIGEEVYKIDPRAMTTRRIREFADAPRNEKRSRMILNYHTEDGSRVVLIGIDENNDSIYVVLDRIRKNYVLTESSLKAGKY